MNLIYGLLLALVAIIAALAAFTRIGAFVLEWRMPATGDFIAVNDTRMHYHFIRSGEDLPTVVFIHGASGNLHDQMSIYKDSFAGRANVLFFDRPGHGYSSAGPKTNRTPQGQAATLAALLDALNVEQATLVGHSFGGAIASSFAVFHPQKLDGLFLISPVSHPWPGGIQWYYNLAERPIIGRLFANTLAFPAGLTRLAGGVACVFAPNKPTPNYLKDTRASLVLRPGHFRQNAIQVAELFDYTVSMQERYSEITAPTIILTGNRDTVVLPDIHSVGLTRAINGAELYWIENLGHKPDHIAVDFVVAAVDRLIGADTPDLKERAAALETSIAGDGNGPIERCLDGGVISKAIAKDDDARLGVVDATYN